MAIPDSGLIDTARELAGKLSRLPRADQRRHLISAYQRHWRTRAVLLDALTDARERARKAKARGLYEPTEPRLEAESDRATDRMLDDLIHEHGITGEQHGHVPIDMMGDFVTRTAAIVFATEVLAGTSELRDAVEHIGAQVDFWTLDGADPSTLVGCDRSYLIETLRSNANAPQRMIVFAMVQLGYSSAEIERVLSTAKGDDVDRAQVRRLVGEAQGSMSEALS